MDTAAATHRATWLCPDSASRARLLDMDARIERPRAAAFAVLGLALLAAIPSAGLWPFLVLLAVGVGFKAVGRLRSRLQRPEYAIYASWAGSQVAVAVAVALAEGSDGYALAWFLIPLITLPARFGTRAVAAGVTLTAVLVTAVVLFAPHAEPMSEALGVVFIVAACIAVAILSTVLMRSDLEHRNDAVIDGLTGMLNRRALEHRLEELAAQSAVTHQPVAVIAGDIDHFKRVNDAHGHATGDAVLVDVTYRLRKRLRAFDLAYRIGGEEFLIVLPGASPEAAAHLAEDLRAVVADEPIGGLPVTISFGVAGSGPGGFEPQAVIAAADAALYAAKAAGRDRVFMDGALVAAQPPKSTPNRSHSPGTLSGSISNP